MSSTINNTTTFFSTFPVVYLMKGEIIIRPDQQLTHVFYLKTGKVRMYAISPEGEEVTLHIFRPSSYFPIMFVLSGIKNPYFFEVTEDLSTAIQVPIPEVVKFLKNNPDALFDLTQRLSEAISGLLIRTENLVLENAYTKIVKLLVYLAEKFGHSEGEYLRIDMPMTHEDIANWIGVRRETVTRQLEKMQKYHFVSTANKRFEILDMNGLKASIKD